MNRVPLLIILLLSCFSGISQKRNTIEVGETMKDFIEDNHIEKIEDMIHQLSYSKAFLNQFVEEEKSHLSNFNAPQIKKKDIKIGEDIDIYVKHITEHQNFTMMLVPISIYNIGVYDTLLFSVLEVTDTWIAREFPYDDCKNDSIKSALLSLKNHDLFAQHLYDQALKGVKSEMGQFKIFVKESYVTANSVHDHMSHMTKEEKKQIRRNWGVLKKALCHDVNMNIELNMYVFGFNDMEVLVKSRKKETTYKVTPTNIFTRHHFQE